MRFEDKVKLYVEKGIPVMLWGLPGIGKTERVNQLAKEMGWHLEVLALNVMEPPDIGGLPVRTAEGVVFEPPAWAKRLVQAHKEGKRPVIFLDEINTAPPAVQKPAYKLVREKYAGETKLPEETAIIAAGNPPEVAGGWDLDSPLANRFAHIQVRADLDEWKAWASRQGRGHARVAAFLTAKPTLLIRYPKDMSEGGLAWPSPRSWDHVAKLLDEVIAGRLELEEAIELFAEQVGEGAAAEIGAWLRQAELVDPKQALNDPNGFSIPKREDAAFSLVFEATVLYDNDAENMTKEDRRRFWSNLWEIYRRIYEGGYKDIAATGASMAVEIYKRSPGLPVPRQVQTFAPYIVDVLEKVRGK